MTTGSMFQNIVPERKNEQAYEDLEKIKDFINKDTGFKVIMSRVEEQKKLFIKAVAR